MPATIDAAAVAVALARRGHADVSVRCLRMLVRWAQDHGIAWTADQVDADPGLTFIPSADGAAPCRWWLIVAALTDRPFKAVQRIAPDITEDDWETLMYSADTNGGQTE
jgi:hypothetical protein